MVRSANIRQTFTSVFMITTTIVRIRHSRFSSRLLVFCDFVFLITTTIICLQHFRFSLIGTTLVGVRHGLTHDGGGRTW